MREKAENVSGSRDFRMIPVATAYWAGCLIGKWLSQMRVIHAGIVAIIGFSFAFLVAFFLRRKCNDWSRTIQAVAYVSLAACMISYFGQCVLSKDVIMQEIRAENLTKIHYSNYKSTLNTRIAEAEVRVLTPFRASKSFNGDCQANVRVYKFANTQSYVNARLYAYNPVCRNISYGMRIRVPVSLKSSRFDNKPELHVQKTQQNVQIIQGSNFWQNSASSLWKSFYNVTNNLDTQGRMLVPGVTIGMLGQEYVPTEATNSLNPIDATYLTMTRQHFQHAGIMHVMAVSGGHFLLLSMIIYRCCSYLLLPRWATSSIQIALQISLAAIVYPSASVLRALIMGIISAVAWCCKRPYQSASALSWTVIGVLLVNPSYAWDYAFALSSAATLGIVVMGVPMSKTFSQYVPHFIASALAITLAAQLWTMPVQILMQPEVSFMSVPANLIIAPFMDWATVFGLISLACASFNAGVSLVFARVSSIGTSFMEKCAYWCDEVSFGVFPWMKGAAGAWMMAVVEVVIFAVFMLVFRSFRNRYYVQRISIIGQLWASSVKRTISEAAQIFE